MTDELHDETFLPFERLGTWYFLSHFVPWRSICEDRDGLNQAGAHCGLSTKL
jgi:hypothetical protein